jgi:hypothetical protein
MSCFEVVHFFQHGQALIASQGLHVVHILAIEVIQDPVPPLGAAIWAIGHDHCRRVPSQTLLKDKSNADA